MTVEIVVFSSEVSRDMDLETAVLMSWLNKRILPKQSNWHRQSDNGIPERKQYFLLKIMMADIFFSSARTCTV